MDLKKELMALGLSDKVSTYVVNHAEGSDLSNLVNAVNGPKLATSIKDANEILKKYGATIQESLSWQMFVNQGFVDDYRRFEDNRDDQFIDIMESLDIDYLINGNRYMVKNQNPAIAEAWNLLNREKGTDMKTNEGIITSMPVLNKNTARDRHIAELRKLAGLSVNEDDDFDIDSENNFNNDFDNLDTMASNIDSVENLPTDDSGIDFSDDDITMPAEPVVPPASSVVTTNPNSMAYNAISDALNNIQRNISDIKLSEYKPLLKRFEELHSQLSVMGKDYLGESILREFARKK